MACEIFSSCFFSFVFFFSGCLLMPFGSTSHSSCTASSCCALRALHSYKTNTFSFPIVIHYYYCLRHHPHHPSGKLKRRALLHPHCERGSLLEQETKPTQNNKHFRESLRWLSWCRLPRWMDIASWKCYSALCRVFTKHACVPKISLFRRLTDVYCINTPLIK